MIRKEILALLLPSLLLGSFAIGWYGHHAPARARITNDSSQAQVWANFAGRPSVRGELNGESCASYTNGSYRTHHGWIVLRCSK